MTKKLLFKQGTLKVFEVADSEGWRMLFIKKGDEIKGLPNFVGKTIVDSLSTPTKAVIDLLHED